ncbi:hypothetical protein P5E54_03900 [Clostridium perfringens]|nr:hypothetical protein [Clostridium perfringens]MDK0809926.1 hypothetical protein [Clostridium perfringens]MDK0879752.1 hypothetical protein [Clostridium perfringens]
MNNKVRAKMTYALKQYEKNIRDAYMKILEVERRNKTRNSKENQMILKRIESIIEETKNEV